MLFHVRDPKLRAVARDQFLESCHLLRQGKKPLRALETDIYVTNACNLRCGYCYFYFEPYFSRPVHNTGRDPSLPQLSALADRLSGKTFCIVLLGGEPFARRDLGDLLAYIRSKDIFSIRVSTNGLLLPRHTNLFKYIDTLSVSFDAMRSRQYPREAVAVLAQLKELKGEYGESLPKVIPSWTTSPDDDFDRDIRPLLDYSLQHGFMVKFLPLKTNQRADWNKQQAVVLQAIAYAGPDAITNQLGHTEQLSDDFGRHNCLLQGNQFYVDYDGQFLYPCDEYADQRVGSVYDIDIDMLYAEGVRRFGEYPRSDGICAHCPSGCHSDNSYILRYPARQLKWLDP